eukprot:3093995-Karenia_brevis.AAC.1
MVTIAEDFRDTFYWTFTRLITNRLYNFTCKVVRAHWRAWGFRWGPVPPRGWSAVPMRGCGPVTPLARVFRAQRLCSHPVPRLASLVCGGEP